MSLDVATLPRWMFAFASVLISIFAVRFPRLAEAFNSGREFWEMGRTTDTVIHLRSRANENRTARDRGSRYERTGRIHEP
jgi:hypothetical protein